MRRIYLALAATSVILTACETTAPTAPTDDTVDIIREAERAENPQYVFAMDTVDQLIDAGNAPAAIDRLTALIGRPDLSDRERATAIFKRGKLRYSRGGFNVWGAIEDFEEVLEAYPEFVSTAEAQRLLDTARGEATSLNFQLNQAGISRNDQFSMRFRLGEHVDAIDFMEATNLTPTNAELVAMYQIGYLCNAEGLTGRSFTITDPQGDTRDVRFCDFGK